MMRQSTLFWIGIAGLLLAVIATVAQEVRRQEEKLAGLHAQIGRDGTAIRVLEAEWSHLNDPGSLEQLAVAHLGLAPIDGPRIVRIADLPARIAPEPGETLPFEGLVSLDRPDGAPHGLIVPAASTGRTPPPPPRQRTATRTADARDITIERLIRELQR
jgi:hypothetical protein